MRQADSFLRRSAQWQFTSSPKSQYWRYKFTWKGEQIRESTKQTNKRVAEQMEAALAKGEVGIREKKPVPTLKEFGARDLLPFVKSTSRRSPIARVSTGCSRSSGSPASGWTRLAATPSPTTLQIAAKQTASADALPLRHHRIHELADAFHARRLCGTNPKPPGAPAIPYRPPVNPYNFRFISY